MHTRRAVNVAHIGAIYNNMLKIRVRIFANRKTAGYTTETNLYLNPLYPCTTTTKTEHNSVCSVKSEAELAVDVL